MSETVTASHVFLGNTASSVDEVLQFLSEKAVELGVTDDAEATLEAFKNREAEGTTGMMGGFAIPHCKSDIVKQATVMVVKFSGEVAWSSMDNAPSSAPSHCSFPPRRLATSTCSCSPTWPSWSWTSTSGPTSWPPMTRSRLPPA